MSDIQKTSQITVKSKSVPKRMAWTNNCLNKADLQKKMVKKQSKARLTYKKGKGQQLLSSQSDNKKEGQETLAQDRINWENSKKYPCDKH